jgi:hypothetical protein
MIMRTMHGASRGPWYRQYVHHAPSPVRLTPLLALLLTACWVSPDENLWRSRVDAGDAAITDARPDAPLPDTVAYPDGFLADQVSPTGAVPIYRSVGPGSTKPLTEGAAASPKSTLTINDTLASFSADLPDKVGVGDAIQYDANADGTITAADGLALIHRRYSARHYSIRASDAAAPKPLAKPTTAWTIFRAYTSLADALAAKENTGITSALRDFDSWTSASDLVVAGQTWNIACYADAAETTPVTISGWTSSADRHLRIFTPVGPHEVGTSQRHTGAAGTGFVFKTGTAAHVLDITSDHVRLEGLEITGWLNSSSNSSWEAVHVAADGARLEALIIHGDDWSATSNPNADAINLNGMSAGQAVTIRNSLIYDISRGAINYQGTAALKVTVESCTIHDTGTSAAAADGQGGLHIASTTATLEVVNTISVGSGSGTDFNSGASWGSSSNNISSDTSAPGSGSLSSKLAANLFTSTTKGGEDLHLKKGSEAVDKGKDLSSRFSVDIDGQTRTGTWDIGADER